MPKKIEQLYADIMKYMDRLEEAVDDRVASAVGFTVRTRILQLVSRGISPIEGKGRFAEYLAKTRSRMLRAGARASSMRAGKLRQERKRLGNALFGGSTKGRARKAGRLARLAGSRARQQRKQARAAGQGYPYNTEEYRKGKKRPRPVNLWLTGEFLRSLTFQILPAGKRKMLSLGWFNDPKNAVKEKGHREGAGGQPKRPILPRAGEKWARTIQLDIMKLLRDAVSKAAKSAKRN